MRFPGGRPKGAIADLQRTMRSHSELATRTLITICGDADARASDRIAAAREILDRGFGRPLQAIDASVLVRKLSEMSDGELAMLEARLVAAQLDAEADHEAPPLN